MGTAIELKPSYWASVSGGKDSLFMLRLILAHPERYPLDGVVHFELEIDYPFIKDVIDYMETECKKHGVRFVRIKPRKSWYELYEKWGMPTLVKRWCNSSYKMDSRRQLEEFMKSQGCYVVSYIGYCADEEKRYAHRDTQKRKEVYPLVDFGVTEDRIWDWAKTQPIFNHYYQVNRRCGCMYCPMADRINLTYLLTIRKNTKSSCVCVRNQKKHHLRSWVKNTTSSRAIQSMIRTMWTAVSVKNIFPSSGN